MCNDKDDDAVPCPPQGNQHGAERERSERGPHGRVSRISAGDQAQAANFGISPSDLATAISYETGGTFDQWQAGPTTQWGQHRGLIQWGEPQRAQYGVTKDTSVDDQMKAVEAYLRDRGVKPGMGMPDMYSTINAGRPGLYDRSDANNRGWHSRR
jgi:hypothetical protein